jgi:hypothetical protein
MRPHRLIYLMAAMGLALACLLVISLLLLGQTGQ